MCIKLVSIKELYYDARPTKSQDNVEEFSILTVFGIVWTGELKITFYLRYLLYPHTTTYWETYVASRCPANCLQHVHKSYQHSFHNFPHMQTYVMRNASVCILRVNSQFSAVRIFRLASRSKSVVGNGGSQVNT